ARRVRRVRGGLPQALRLARHLRKSDARRHPESCRTGLRETAPHGGRAEVSTRGNQGDAGPGRDGGQAMSARRLVARCAALFVGALVVNAFAAGTEPVGMKVPPNQRFVLPNGLTIVLLPKRDVPLIAFSGFVRGGQLADPAGKAGVSSLVAGLLDHSA